MLFCCLAPYEMVWSEDREKYPERNPNGYTRQSTPAIFTVLRLSTPIFTEVGCQAYFAVTPIFAGQAYFAVHKACSDKRYRRRKNSVKSKKKKKRERKKNCPANKYAGSTYCHRTRAFLCVGPTDSTQDRISSCPRSNL